ncbi:MAG: HAMP domain-containing histidine kinase [Lachnospiraceae bacterium]|nr:HAMP domain-containing histidine kinase [Lachnospiraceae bacterium]
MYRPNGDQATSTKGKSFLLKYKFLRSFRLRIFLIIMLIGMCSLVIMRRGLLANERNAAIDQRSSSVMSMMRILSNRIGSSFFLEDISDGEISGDLELLAEVYNARFIVTDSELRIVFDTADIDTGKYLLAGNAMGALRGKSVSEFDKEEGVIEIAVPVYSSTDEDTGKSANAVILAEVSAKQVLNAVEQKSERSLLIELLAAVILLGVALIISNIVVRPFDRVTRAIRGVVSYEDSELVVSDYVETEEIVDAFNDLRTRMKAVDESRQEFVSNVSHELKTPMASIKVLADSINMMPDAPMEMYQDFMQDISAEIDRENAIISNLLSLVKMDKGAGALDVQRCDINLMLENLIKRLGPLAKKSEVDIILESMRNVTADVDELKLGSAITNLIENGIKYNKKPGWVKAHLDADHRFFTLTISDSGIGIPKEEQAHIFERFYRVDKSHSKEISGSGLGLSIARRTILLHRGSIKVDSEPGEGTTFTIRIPLSYIADNTSGSD